VIGNSESEIPLAFTMIIKACNVKLLCRREFAYSSFGTIVGVKY
jgi:hypothetical protein